MKGLTQYDAPLYQAAHAYLKRDYISLHVPLHGRGAGAPHLARSRLAPLLRWDLTEVEDLDDLHLPGGPLRQAQLLAARLFGASQTFFLVNGVTGGLLALLSAVVRPGEKVLLSRLSHKAALHGLILSGAVPVYLPVEQEPHSGFPLNVSLTVVEKALRRHPDARLLLLTSPTYWGVTAHLEQISQLCRDYGVLFAVDEAHGTHLPFYGDLPHSAAAGADFWLHSAHKSLGALTPGAFLHLAAAAQPIQPLRFWLQALQTSSPSYPVMISLDLARRQAALNGKALFHRARAWARSLRRGLLNEGLALLSEKAVKAAGFALDPCRVTLLLSRGGGMQMAKQLARSCRLQVEMAGENYLLAVCGPAQLTLSPQALAHAVGRVAPKPRRGVAASVTAPPYCFAQVDPFGGNLDPFTLPPGEAVARPAISLPLEECAEKICAEMVVSVPPGIPLLAPGERISMEMRTVLLQLRDRKTRFQGAADPTLGYIKCLVPYR